MASEDEDVVSADAAMVERGGKLDSGKSLVPDTNMASCMMPSWYKAEQ